MRDRVYPAVIRTSLGLFRALDLRFTVEGAEHVPVSGPAVLVANHVSYLDFTFVGYAAHHVGRLVRFMAKRSVFDHPVSGPLMRGMQHIPVDRAAGAAAYRSAITALQAGELVGVFPEQTISRSFELRPFRNGAVRMAAAAQAPLIPVITWGGQRLWTSGRRPQLHRHVPITLSVGEPLPPPDGDPTEATARLRAAMAARLARVQRDYSGGPGAGSVWWQPAALGGTAPTPAEAKALEVAAIAGRRSGWRSGRSGPGAGG